MYTNFEDVLASWISSEPLPPESVVETWISKAERLILVHVPDLETRLANNLTSVDHVKDVVIDLVSSVFRNPQGIRSIQESNGLASGSVTFAGDSPGVMRLTDWHYAQLGAPRRGRRKAGTVNTWG